MRYRVVIMKKFKLLFLFFSLVSSLQASALDKPHIPAGPNTGVLFVHGTSDHSQDAEGGYWKSDLIDGVVSALPNPNNYFVAHCDFTHYMWHEDSAGCLASQAEQFIEEKKIEDLIESNVFKIPVPGELGEAPKYNPRTKSKPKGKRKFFKRKKTNKKQ